MKNKQYLTPNEVAELLMVSPVTVRQWASKGMIKALSTPGGHRRFTYDEVERFANQHDIDLSNSNKTEKVLIVDDDPHLRSFISEALSMNNENVNVESAENGFEAGQMVQAFRPDVIILDLMMPGLNGFSVCKQLKENPKTEAIRVLAMTGFYTKENVDRIKAAGAEHCFRKPIDIEELIDVVFDHSD